MQLHNHESDLSWIITTSQPYHIEEIFTQPPPPPPPPPPLPLPLPPHQRLAFLEDERDRNDKGNFNLGQGELYHLEVRVFPRDPFIRVFSLFHTHTTSTHPHTHKYTDTHALARPLALSRPERFGDDISLTAISCPWCYRYLLESGMYKYIEEETR